MLLATSLVVGVVVERNIQEEVLKELKRKEWEELF